MSENQEAAQPRQDEGKAPPGGSDTLDNAPAGFAAARLITHKRDHGVIFIAASEERARRMGSFLKAAAPQSGALLFPPWDCLPYDTVTPSRAVMGQRMTVLGRIASSGARGLMIITTYEAALQRVPPPSAISSLALLRDGPLDIEALQRFCAKTGYILDERVDEAGEAAFRGEVIEVFAAGRDQPLRIQPENGRIATIRRYDPLTQRTLAEEDEITLFPAVEPQPDGSATLFSMMPKAAVIEEQAGQEHAADILSLVTEAYDGRTEASASARPPEALYMGEDEWKLLRQGRRFEPPASAGWLRVPQFWQAASPRTALATFIEEQAALNRRIVLLSADRKERDGLTRRVCRFTGRSAEAVRDWQDVIDAAPGAVLTLDAHLDEGFVDTETAIAVLAARDIIGSRARSEAGDVPALPLWQAEISELAEGDTMVHAERGIGILEGLETVEAQHGPPEAFLLRYAGDGKLLVPVNEAQKLWRYGSGADVALDRLNTGQWSKRRARIEQGLIETARKLLEDTAKRRAERGPAMTPPAARYERFAARFPHAETRDQRLAINTVLGELASGHPMDRLVIGDVGFGKTEVALRAAAAAALAGWQVAVLAPTTVLVRQHLDTFRRRFGGFGIAVGQLSRLVASSEARTTREKLADGSLQIVVGTHAVLGKTVRFAKLGLIIIDEEHRFGAAQKSRLRSIAPGAHLLSLSATPIPRTLQTALAGLRDVSTILTPPSRRRPVRTIVAPHSPAVMQQALRHEKRRGGQSFVVVPRIADIEPVLAQLGELVPELSVTPVHGELPPAEADSRFVGFAEGRSDILLATSIIESGLDVPRANTMIVREPDLFGLAELHQLRGRVGRGAAQAFCHLMTETGRPLSESAAKRLQALETLSSLGAGAAVAARDLDLRGGGDLFGATQSGHVKLIGLGLYQEFLAEALRQARGLPPAPPPVKILCDAEAAIPADYIPDEQVRMTLYHRIARTTEPEAVDALADEIADRFGPPPEAVVTMLNLAAARTRAAQLGIRRIAAGPEGIAFDFDSAEDAASQAQSFGPGEACDIKGNRLLVAQHCETARESLVLLSKTLDTMA